MATIVKTRRGDPGPPSVDGGDVGPREEGGGPAVLILTKDPALGAAIRHELESNELGATVVSGVAEAHEHAESARCQAFIVDLGLPEGEGYRFVADLRYAGGAEPVLLLSAPHAPEDLLTVQRAWPGWQSGVRAGLHDVPSIVRALLRHEQADSARHLRYWNAELDRFERRVVVGGAELPLTPAEYTIFEELLLNAEHLVTRAGLTEAVWGPDREPSSNALDVHLGHLRRKLRATGDLRIETLRGRGYVLRRRRTG